MGIVWSTWIWEEQFDEQFLMIHWVVIASELSQLTWIFELISKSWFRGNWSGNDKDDVPGINAIEGGEQPKRKQINFGNNVEYYQLDTLIDSSCYLRRKH